MCAKSFDRPQFTRRQAGMTTLGMAILAAFAGLFAFAALLLTPVYLNYMKVSSILSGVQVEFDGVNASRTAIRNSISRRIDIDMVSEITAKDIKISRVSGGHEIAATYTHKTSFIANVSFVVDFDKRVLVRR
jgi:hypothetical protein